MFSKFYILSHIASVCLISPSLDFAKTKFTAISEIYHSSDADFIFLKDNTNQQEWIYKQISDQSPDDQIVIVWERIASEIASTLNIPINQVFLISPDDDFEYSFIPKYPGSLHLKVSGENVEKKLPWEDFDIHQKIRSPFMTHRLGPLQRENIGLRKIIIQNMGKHEDLAKLVALDTYLGNNDRSALNTFYDAKNNAFYGIDMGNCLTGNLPLYADENLRKIIEEKIELSKEEKAGLDIYKKTLELLVLQFPPTRIIELLEHSLKKAGFSKENNLLWNTHVEQKIQNWKNQIDANYKSTVKLLSTLNEFKI
jgi:hypothetical protein